MATTQSHGRLSISGLGWSLSATLVVLFVLCMVAALFVPLRLGPRLDQCLVRRAN